MTKSRALSVLTPTGLGLVTPPGPTGQPPAPTPISPRDHAERDSDRESMQYGITRGFEWPEPLHAKRPHLDAEPSAARIARVALSRMEGYTNDEAADQLGSAGRLEPICKTWISFIKEI